jgi:hypothetical protein
VRRFDPETITRNKLSNFVALGNEQRRRFEEQWKADLHIKRIQTTVAGELDELAIVAGL